MGQKRPKKYQAVSVVNDILLFHPKPESNANRIRILPSRDLAFHPHRLLHLK